MFPLILGVILTLCYGIDFYTHYHPIPTMCEPLCCLTIIIYIFDEISIQCKNYLELNCVVTNWLPFLFCQSIVFPGVNNYLFFFFLFYLFAGLVLYSVVINTYLFANCLNLNVFRGIQYFISFIFLEKFLFEFSDPLKSGLHISLVL